MYDTNNDMNDSTFAGALPSGEVATALPLQVGAFTFNIASQVVNTTTASSLISNITVDNVSIALNATVIICTEDETGMQDMVIVNVIDTDKCNSTIIIVCDCSCLYCNYLISFT